MPQSDGNKMRGILLQNHKDSKEFDQFMDLWFLPPGGDSFSSFFMFIGCLLFIVIIN